MAFKPGGPVPKKHTGDFEHMQDFDDKKKNFRGPDGVIIGPKNLYTNPPKKGMASTTPGLLIKKEYPEYMEDPYNRKHELQKKELEDHRKKIGEQKAFNPTIHGMRTF